MEIARTVAQLRSLVESARANHKSIGLVPTMGALHAGHLSLMAAARRDNDIVVASVFVNPTQFNNPEDLKTYPRTEDADLKALSDSGVDIAFVPSVEEIYPDPDTRVFDLGPVAEVMEGAMRPGHFNGVAQIVSRLFRMVTPDRAYFGEKDFQQIAVIRRMIELEGLDDITIVPCPICRADDGLALSSRNVRLTAEQRAIAPLIHKTLLQSVDWSAHMTVSEVIERVTEQLNSIDQLDVEYYQIVHPLTMQPVKNWSDAAPEGAVGCITVYCGPVRLIDNIKYPAQND